MLSIVHFFSMGFLSYGANYLGYKIANFVYYDLLHSIDPFSGPSSVRMIIESFIQAFLVGIAIAIYILLLRPKKSSILFLATIIFSCGAIVLMHSRIVGGFSVNDSFWLYYFSVYSFTLIAIWLGSNWFQTKKIK